MKNQKNRKLVIVTSANYNSDGYYLIRIPVQSLSTPLCIDERTTEYGTAVKEVLQEAVNRRGRLTLIYYLLKPHYTELMLYAKHNETVKDRDAKNKNIQSFMNIFKRLTEEKTKTKLWQEGYLCHRIRRGKEISDILAQL